MLPKLPAGTIIQSGASQLNCLTISIPTLFWPSIRKLFIEFAKYILLSCVTFRTISMQPSKSVSKASTCAPLAIGCINWALVILSLGKKTIAGIPAAAAYAAKDALVSPVDAHATARTVVLFCSFICFTTLTSAVIPRSLKLPVWLFPHNLTQRFVTPSFSPSRSAQNK